MLRSVLVAAFSAVAAFATLSGLSGAKAATLADSVWSSAAPADSVWSAPAPTVVVGGDTSDGTDDSVWS
ncbi:hypothetical protein WN71_001740 [Streptomyces mangrovisoli]|uniref:5'-nucleotidase n=1 Tax=Streptomyces mangrovisoli TaxID=1428628 RepID=A0A1J4P4X8_9ACTN|nr:hypothetical protein WN71_001740 [Streptomyces mangrovisoli]